jgi:predicted HicB family RNase H-like nuclease
MSTLVICSQVDVKNQGLTLGASTNKGNTMSNESKFTTIRIDKKLHEELKLVATSQNRSLSSQIVFILRQYIEKAQK